MHEGKLLGKGLFYIKDLDQTLSKDEICEYTEEQFSMLLSFCNESELGRLYLYMEAKGLDDKCVQVLEVLFKVEEK